MLLFVLIIVCCCVLFVAVYCLLFFYYLLLLIICCLVLPAQELCQCAFSAPSSPLVDFVSSPPTPLLFPSGSFSSPFGTVRALGSLFSSRCIPLPPATGPLSSGYLPLRPSAPGSLSSSRGLPLLLSLPPSPPFVASLSSGSGSLSSSCYLPLLPSLPPFPPAPGSLSSSRCLPLLRLPAPSLPLVACVFYQ